MEFYIYTYVNGLTRRMGILVIVCPSVRAFARASDNLCKYRDILMNVGTRVP